MPFYNRKTNRRSRNVSAAENTIGPIDPPPAPLCCLCEPDSYVEPIKPANYGYDQSRPQGAGYLPKTMSAATAATEQTSPSLYSQSNASVSSASRTPSPLELCPVTGVYANINDDYYIFPKVLGKGHYGIVRECIHRATRQTLAVKSIDKSKIGRLDHLQREIFLLANVNHDGIMKMVDCYEDAESVHIITEKYTGGELFDKIVDNTNASGCLNERKAARVIKSLLEAVGYLHENGIVHRDIKPENILFSSADEDAAVKLIDFGLARRHNKGVDPFMANPVGTAYYMSPELLKGKYDSSSDIWSIGIVTYIILCGYPPFNGGTDSEIQDSTRRGKLHFQGNAWLNKSDEAKDFVKCLLRRDPRKRAGAKEALCHPWLRKNVM